LFEFLKNRFKKDAAGTYVVVRDGVREVLVKWTNYQDAMKAIDLGYSQSAIVYSCVEKRAQLVASVDWLIEERKGNEWESVKDDHQLNALLEYPNPYQSWYELIYQASQQLDLTGNAFIRELKVKSIFGSQKLTAELQLLESKFMTVVGGYNARVEKYVYTINNKKEDIAEDEIIHLMLPNPSSQIFGLSKLKAVGMAIDIDREAAIWQKVSLSNRGMADIYVKVDPSTTPEQMSKIKEALKENYQSPQNARKPFVTTAEIQNLGLSAGELDFINSRKANWTEITAAFGMSPANLGMTENVNLANAESMDKALWQNTIIPHLTLLSKQLTNQLAREFGDIRMRPDYTNVAALQESLDKKLERAGKLWAMGVSFNDINQKLELGFDDIVGGDIGYLSSSVFPIISANAEDDEPVKSGEAAYGKNINR
jgi:HK97 family phage portal protein